MIGTDVLEIQRRSTYQVYTIMSEMSSKNETILLTKLKIFTIWFYTDVC